MALRTNAAKDIRLQPGQRGIGIAAGSSTVTAIPSWIGANWIAVLIEALTAARPTAT